jgi:hypothetical protein
MGVDALVDARRVGLVRCFVVVTLVSALPLATVTSSAIADTGAEAEEGNHGLPPGVSQPEWAIGQGIQFTPSPRALRESTERSAVTSTALAPDALTPDVEKSNGEGCLEGGRYCGPGTPPVVYKGGEVQLNPTLHVIFWGEGWSKSGSQEAEARGKVEHLLSVLSGSEYQGILTQYDDHTGHVSATLSAATYYIDPSSAVDVSKAAVIAEAEKAISAKKWATGVNAQFIVLVSGTFEKAFTEEGGEVYCGFHAVLEKTSVVTEQSAYSFIPYQGEGAFREAGCGGIEPSREAPYFTQAVVSHEYAESATDPYSAASPAPNGTEHAWIENGSTHSEIADFCEEHKAWDVALEATVNALWDNHLNECRNADASPPPAAIPPLATGQAATGVTCTTATLNGSIEPTDAETEYYFEYGDGEGATKTVPAPNGKLASSWAIDPESYGLSGLTSNKKYRFIVYATNANGKSEGASKTFETTCAAPTAVTEAATAETTRGATLHARVDPDGTETKYYFEYGTEKGKFEYRTAEASAGPYDGTIEGSESISGLIGGMEYYYRVVASNSRGTTEGAERSFTTVTPTWSLTTTRNPAEDNADFLSAVSCSSITACTAVGGFANTHDTTEPTAERWNGKEWSLQSVPNPSKNPVIYPAGLGSVVCTTTTNCIAMGGTRGEPFAAGWNGTEWSLQSVPAPAESNSTTIEKVSCISTTECVAVGFYDPKKPVNENEVLTIAERWNGKAWEVVNTANPTDSQSYLRGLSCVSATWCVATGNSYSLKGGTRTGIAEFWNGSTWTVESTPLPSGGEAGELYGVSCASSSTCISTGRYVPKPHELALMVDRWNGKSWTAETPPSPVAPEYTNSELYQPACALAMECVAVGFSDYSAVADKWNGKEWSSLATASLGESVESSLSGLWCSPSSSQVWCIATGSSDNRTLGEIYE